MVEDALEGEVVDVLGEEVEEEEAAKVHLVQIHLHLGVLSDVAPHLQKISKENVDRVARLGFNYPWISLDLGQIV